MRDTYTKIMFGKKNEYIVFVWGSTPNLQPKRIWAKFCTNNGYDNGHVQSS